MLSFFSMFYWLCYYSCPISFLPTQSSIPIPSSIPSYFRSCPWVVHISSLASPFPILFLTSPCLFCTYQLCFLFLHSFSLIFPHPLTADNPPYHLHFCDSAPVLVVQLVHFCFCIFGSLVDSCEFVVILLCIVLILFFFLDTSL